MLDIQFSRRLITSFIFSEPLSVTSCSGDPYLGNISLIIISDTVRALLSGMAKASGQPIHKT